MQAFLAGLVFAALFVLGVLTVWVQSESLQIGYEIESMRHESEALRRENDALRMRLASMTTPASLLDRASLATVASDEQLANDLVAVDDPSRRLMPDWNIVWVNSTIGEPVELARRDGEDRSGE